MEPEKEKKVASSAKENEEMAESKSLDNLNSQTAPARKLMTRHADYQQSGKQVLPSMKAQPLFYGEDMNTCSFSKECLAVCGNHSLVGTSSCSKQACCSELRCNSSVHSLVHCPSEVLNHPNKAVFTIETNSFMIMVANKPAMTIFGYTSEELINMAFPDLFFDQQPKFWAKVIAQLEPPVANLQTSIITNGKLVAFKTKSKEMVLVSLWIKRMDISNQLIAVAEVAKSYLGKMILDKAGIVLRADLVSARDIFMCDESALEGKGILDFIPYFKMDQLECRDELWEGGKVCKKEYYTARTVSFESAIPLIVRLIHNAECYTYTLELKLIQSPSGLLVVNDTGLIQACNKNFTHPVFGYNDVDLIGKPVDELILSFCQTSSKPVRCSSPSSLSTMACDGGPTEEIDDLSTFYSARDTELTSQQCTELPPESDEWNSSMETVTQDMFDDENKAKTVTALVNERVAGGDSVSSSEDPTPTGSLLGDLYDTAESSYELADSDDEDVVVKSSLTSSSGLASGAGEVENIDIPVRQCSAFCIVDSNEIASGACNVENITILIRQCSSFSNAVDNDLFARDVPPMLGNNLSASSSIEALSSLTASNSGRRLKAGFHIGVGVHRDGGHLSIEYHVMKVVLDGMHVAYLVWVNLERRDPPSLTLFSDTSLYFKQLTDAQLSSGPYSETYTNGSRIGKGSFGLVTWATSKLDNHTVATKFIAKSRVSNQRKVEHMTYGIVPQEVAIVMSLDHPNIIKMKDFFKNELFYIMVMEANVLSVDVYRYLRFNVTDEPLNAHIFRQIMGAVKYLHSQNIVHRDIKDENTLIDSMYNIKLIDFGSAGIILPGKLFTGVYGTLEYTSPEVLKGEQYAGPELEVWTLGCLLYLLSFAQPPFQRIENVINGELTIRDVNDDLRDLLFRMLEYNKDIRITVDEVLSHRWTNQLIDFASYQSLEDQGLFNEIEESETSSNVVEVSSAFSYEMISFVSSSDILDVDDRALYMDLANSSGNHHPLDLSEGSIITTTDQVFDDDEEPAANSLTGSIDSLYGSRALSPEITGLNASASDCENGDIAMAFDRYIREDEADNTTINDRIDKNDNDEDVQILYMGSDFVQTETEAVEEVDLCMIDEMEGHIDEAGENGLCKSMAVMSIPDSEIMKPGPSS